MGGYAWVTLATNNSYSLGALVLAHSLKKSNTAHKLVVLITSAVSESMRNQLNTVFDVVRLVDVLDSKDEAHLALMQRPELGITFTKIHCWRLIEFEKCVFLDADTLVVRNCDELFEREEFSAAPDASWPDCFNSGVFVFRPSIETFNKILQFAVENKSFDGGDQGLLNQFFSNWATEDIKKHLPFVYNLTSIGPYSYIPAFKHYGSETRIVHFIGTGKPWLQQLDVATKTVTPSSGYEHLGPLLQQWWDLFCEKVHPNLDKNLESSNEGMSHPPVEACSNSLPIALTDAKPSMQTVDPCTQYNEKGDAKHNLPHKPHVPSGESSTPVCSFSPVVVVALPESRGGGAEGRNETGEAKVVEEGHVCKTPERFVRLEIQERVKEERRSGEEKEGKQEEPPPAKDPFDYETFFPDENCIQNYLEQNVVTYQPFDCHTEVKTPGDTEPEEDVPSLPRFLTIPEDDRRQSGNVEVTEKSPKEDPPPQDEPQKEPTPQREEPVTEKRELTKSKSMPFLPTLDVTSVDPPPTPLPPRSIWKSQPNVSSDPNKKYSMPRLKPIIPKQNSFGKSVRTSMPKVTHYTEFLMSSEYKDPVNLPKDRIGFVATQLHKESKPKRSNKSNVRPRFGPLPFVPSPEAEKPVFKKIRLEHSDNDLYDLTQCKRQSGNKSKPKDVRRKENGNNLEEILERLREFSKDYQHYFGVVPKPKRRTVTCKNAAVQANGDGECRTSDAFKTVRTFVTNWSRGTQTSDISRKEGGVDGSEFRLFRNYVKDQNEASQEGLVMISRRGGEGKGRSKGFTFSGVAEGAEIRVKTIDGEMKNREHIKPTRNEGKPKIADDEYEKTRRNVNDDVITEQKKGGNFKSEIFEIEDLAKAQTKHSENVEKLVVHSKNQLILNVEQNDETNKNIAYENSDKSYKSTPKENHSPVVHSRSDVNSPKKPTHVLSTHTESPKVQNESVEKSVVRSKTQSISEVGENRQHSSDENCASETSTYDLGTAVENVVRSSSDVEPPKNSTGVMLGLEKHSTPGSEPAKVQITSLAHPETEEEFVVHSKNQTDDVINAQNNGTSGYCKQNQTVVSSVEGKTAPLDSKNDEVHVVHSKNQTDDVINAQNNGTSGFCKENQTVVSLVEGKTAPPHSENDEVHVVHSKNSPNLVLEQKNFAKTESNGVLLEQQNHSELEMTKSGTESPKVQSSHSEVLPKTVEHSENLVSGRSDDVAKSRNNGTYGSLDKSYNSNVEKSTNDDAVLPENSESQQESCIPECRTDETTESTKSGTCTENKPDESSKSKEANYSTPVLIQRINPDDVTREVQHKTTASLVSSPVGAVPNGRTPRENGIGTGKPKEAENEMKERVQKPPEEMLCVPDFETPRTSRVTPTDSKEKSKTHQKHRKSRSSPKKVHENRYAVLPDDSPGETVRFAGEKPPPNPNDEPERMEETESTSGIAGAIAQLSLQAGSEEETPAASTAHQEYLRRQNWETGNIDYMGRDSFDNIWSKICQTLEAKEQPAEAPTTTGDPSSIPPNVPDFIETLPGKPAPGPVEDDEIIFSKSDTRQPGLTNISEEEEVGGEGVKLSDILGKVGEGNAVEKKGGDAGKKPPIVPGVEILPGGDLKPTEIPAETETRSEMSVDVPVGAKPVPPPLNLVNKPGEETPLSAAEEKQPRILAKDEKGTAQPEKKAEECKVVAIPSPPILPTEKPYPKGKKQQDKPQIKSEPIPLPPPDSPSPESPLKPSTSDSLKDENKQKKGVFSKILEMVGVSPKEKNGTETSKSMFYDVEGGAVSEDEKQTTGVEEVKKSEQETSGGVKEERGKATPSAEELKSEVGSQQQESVQEAKTVEGKEPEVGGEPKSVAPIPKPERAAKDSQKPTDSIQMSETKRKSPSPKLTMPQTPPETAVTTPTPPPNPDIPPRKNSALLKVEDTILETPPVPEPPKLQTEIEEIIGKAKTEVETLLQDRRSAEKETSDLINTMKLMVGEEQQPQPEKATPEEVEELRVTTEEERKRHKGEAVSSKLSDQILKAIPPPRRKAISEASASTSAIPKASGTPEQKNPTGEGKAKSSKPSSIPVPPPRSRGKPTQPPPSKGKGKK